MTSQACRFVATVSDKKAESYYCPVFKGKGIETQKVRFKNVFGFRASSFQMVTVPDEWVEDCNV